MPFISLRGKKIYYEKYGEGSPLLMLNGMMMNTLSWVPFVRAFLKDYEVILIDLLDQGKADSADEPYSLEMHVDMLKDFLDALNYDKVNLLGISYGGEVAMLFGLKYQERLESLILSNTTSNPMEDLEEIKENWEKAAKTYDASVLLGATSKYMYSEEFYKENVKILRAREKLLQRSLSRSYFDRFIRELKSAKDFDVTQRLKNIKLPVLIIGAEKDRVAPVRCQENILREIPGAKLSIIKNSGHAPMYEKPGEYAQVITEFLRGLLL